MWRGKRIANLVLHKLSAPAERPYNVREEAKYKKQAFDESKIQEDK